MIEDVKMALVDYRMDENVAVVSMNSGENRFNYPFLEAMNKVLDQIEDEGQATAIVVTSSDEKIWCNGIDLNWFQPLMKEEGPEAAGKFISGMYKLFYRTLLSPLMTVAAINGHAFAGGAIWSCAFDFRFMQTGRGFFCFPEVDIKMPFSPFLVALTEKAIPKPLNSQLHLFGKRAVAEELAEVKAIIKASDPDTVIQDAIDFIKPMKKEREILKVTKERLYHNAVKVYKETTDISG